MSNDNTTPYQSLGNQLKRLREKRRESLAEVSGAVEIDLDDLTAIEAGADRPSEDILMLLISHFDAKDDIANKLWELAGYDQRKDDITGMDLNTQSQPAIMLLPMDARIVYSDAVNIMVNNHGVVFNFLQGGSPSSQPLTIARVGMSRQHAESVLEVLRKTLDQSKPKGLPSPKPNDAENQKNS